MSRRRLWPVSLTHRLTVMVVGLVLAVTILVSGITLFAMAEITEDQLESDAVTALERGLRNFAGIAAGIGPPTGTPLAQGDRGPGRGDRAPGLLDSVQAIFPLDATAAGVQARGSYADRRGDVEALDDEQLRDLAQAAQQLQRQRRGGRSDDVEVDGLGEFRVVARQVVDFEGSRALIIAGVSAKERTETLTRLLLWELALLALAGGASFLAGALLVRRALTPLREVAEVAHDVAELPLDQGEVGQTLRVPEQLTDARTEVGQVGAALNRMLGHVEQSLDARHRSEQQVRQFVADASHELRTPLTTIRGYAELAGSKPELLPEAMAKVTEESGRMTALVEDLLLLARLDAGRPLERTSVDLTALCLGAIGDARVVAPQHRWLLDLPSEPVNVTGDELRLHQVVTNLLANARRHTPPGTTVSLALKPTPSQVELIVRDDGPGLPPGVDVFERFARGDSSRTRASGGAGLGLALVAAIVGALGGSVRTFDAEPGAGFVVQLPR